MAPTPTSNPNAAVVDASVIVSIASKEIGTYLVAKNAFDTYAQNVIVGEVMFALCQKFATGILTEAEFEQAIESFLDYMTIVETPDDETSLVKRAVEIQETYGCSRSSDSIYIALAEDLAKNRTVELFTFDRGMNNQAAKNAPTVTVKVL